MVTISRLLDPTPVTDLADYVDRHDGGAALSAAREAAPDVIVAEVEGSGLRGRGGAGFPTGVKWRTVASDPATAQSIIVNAAEGEPGTFKDRMLLRSNPYLVLEGAYIAAVTMGASEVIVAIKASFEREIARLKAAQGEFEAAGMASGISMRIVEGPGEYLFGEETAMLEVIEGEPPFPRVVAPYRRGLGDGDHRDPAGAGPILVDNVETLANIPAIVARGADWFRSVGTDDSPGTILCTVTGDVARHGVGEFAMGTPLREVIETVGGDVSHLGMVLMGVSSAPLTADQVDTPLTYEHMTAAGSGLGSASFIVVDAARDTRDIAAGVARFLAIESCGQCTPCKHDGLAIAERLTAAADDHEADVDIDARLRTVATGARCALAGQTERVVGRLFGLAGDRDPGSTVSPWLIAPLVDIVDGRAVLDESHRTKRADWSFEGEERDSYHDPVQRYADEPVTIRATHTPESSDGDSRPVVGTSPGRSDRFAAIHDVHTEIEDTMAALRTTKPEDRALLLDRLRHLLDGHREVVETYVYPLVERLEPELGADVTWYPKHHDHHARRLLERLRTADASTGTRLLDDLCADVHASIIEIDLRVLPLLDRDLDDPAFERELDAIAEEDLDED